MPVLHKAVTVACYIFVRRLKNLKVMNQTLNYKASYTSDSYQILRDSLQIGKLYKAEWLGNPIDSVLNEHKFRFISKGIFKPTISVLDISSNSIVGTINFQNLLSFYQSAVLTLSNGTKYRWSSNKLFANDWQWTDLSNDEIIFTSKEPLDAFKQYGTIIFNDRTHDKELFISLGIHLRNVAKRKSHLPKIMAIIILLALLPRLFY
jgi:hypothetical protein